MKELDRFIKEINLIFTNTVNRFDTYKKSFDINKIDINYENTISLYSLVYSFNKLYLAFKKDYDKLDKLELGEYTEILKFREFNTEEDNYRNLKIYIENPSICNCDDTILYLEERNDEVYSFTLNKDSNNDYHRQNIELDSIKIKNYLDLFKKHELFLETYNILKNQFVFGDGCNTLFTAIHGELTKQLNSFELALGKSSLNIENFIKLKIKLEENLSIDYDKCNIILDNQTNEVNKDTINSVLKKVYVNKKYLKKE